MTVTWAGAAVAAFAGAALAAAGRMRRMRLAARIQPYRRDPAGARSPRDGAAWTAAPARISALAFGGPGDGAAADASRRRRRDASLAARLRAAGRDEGEVEAFRVRQWAQAGAGAAAGLVVGGAVLRSPGWMVVLGVCAAAVGSTRAPARLARDAEARARRMRLELVTIDQVLAIHVRAGAGPVQAVTRVVARGHGVVVDELRAILASIRAGRSEAEAFRHAARTTAEPHAARTYRLFALAAEQGADLGSALRALSDDLRDVRRDELRRDATKRRAAMLLPTIAVLAPIMLLFVIAPMPSVVLGGP